MGGKAGKELRRENVPSSSAATSSCFYEDFGNGRALRFHEVHGRNVVLSPDGKTAKRYNSFCYGIAFSSRTIAIGERVSIKLKTVQHQWSGVMRFGVTQTNPSVIDPSTLPRYACPDLTNQPGYWAKALPDDFAVEGHVISFYITNTGDLHLQTNDEDHGVFISGIEVDLPLWVITDIYGNTTALTFLGDEPSPSRDQSGLIIDDNGLLQIPQGTSLSHYGTKQELRRAWNILPSTQIREFPFSEVVGQSAALSHGNCIASKANYPLFQSSVVFSGEPISPGTTWYLKAIGSGDCESNNIAIGVTSCNPSSLDSSELPYDPDDLIDRPEYWVLFRDFRPPFAGDFFSISLNPDGFVQYKVAHETETNLFYCDTSQPLWIVVDLGCNLKMAFSIGVCDPHTSIDDVPHTSSAVFPPQVEESGGSPDGSPVSGDSTESMLSDVNINLDSMVDEVDNQLFENLGLRKLTEGRHGLMGLLMTSLARSLIDNAENDDDHHSSSSSDGYHEDMPASSSMHDESEEHAPEAVDLNENAASHESGEPTTSQSSTNDAAMNPAEPTTTPECTICYDRPADAAIYNCGHVCMCEACGKRLIRTQRLPKCPICRKPIKDIMKLYHA